MHRSRHWWLLLLLVPFIAVLWMPFYNHASPSLAGFPFFYVWQLGWIVGTSLLTFIVYRRWRA